MINTRIRKGETRMQLCSLYSGSSGNSIYVGNENTHFLVDVGVSAKKLEKALAEIDLTVNDMAGIFITHEHSDHISGLGVIARRYGIPMYGTAKTLEAVKAYKTLGEVDYSLFQAIEPDEDFMMNDIKVRAIRTWHDATDPVCYTFKQGKRKISIATDLGNFDAYIINNLKDSDILLIEANHDINMLEVGPYPYYLKQRILGDRGHLSNERSGQLIKQLLNNHIKGILLGHLSKENNFPELAYETVYVELLQNPYTSDIQDFNIKIANRDSNSDMIVA